MAFDESWGEAVFRSCDPVFAAADVGFEGRFSADNGVVSAFLWEADPHRFAERYPDSGIIESYGEVQWSDVHCVDYWVYVEAGLNRCRVSVEGWNLAEFFVEATGRGDIDGMNLASLVARILAVPWPAG